MTALKDLRVLDLSRVLAGPVCTQILGDMGADIIKIEKPGQGDDTRFWGPPFLKDDQGRDTDESAYYLSANRNKRSVAIDIASEEGQAVIHKLIEQSDILIENFKAGGLRKYGLDYESLKQKYPHLIYCSITGFGQTGPLASEPGYDFLAQAMGGLMAVTGEPEGEPMKAGVALSDVMTGLHAAIGILAALHHREKTGQGQHIDLALLDCTIAAMTNIAQYYLTSGELAPRQGNAHSTIVPYQAFPASDGHIVIAIGNDRQFKRFSDYLDTGWAEDTRFATNSARVENRDSLIPEIRKYLEQKSQDEWIGILRDIDVPCAKVNTMDQTFADPQTRARDMQIGMEHADRTAPVNLVGSPFKMSGTSVAYDRAPPVLGQHTEEVLLELTNKSREEISRLCEKHIIQT